MKLDIEIRWMKPEDCNKPLKIIGFDVIGKDKILTLDTGTEFIKTSIFGKNFNYLYNVLGPESNEWLHHVIVYKQETENGKLIRTIYSAN